MNYAYARVSATDQNLARQLKAFEDFGIEAENVFSDKKSGENFERVNYRKLLKILKKGDLVVIKSIDRLGRSYKSIIEEWNRITNKIGADILVLDMHLLDTRGRTDTLVNKFIFDVVLQLLSFVAENERDNIRARQAEGIRIAKQNGVKFGRPPKEYSPEILDLLRNYKIGNVSLKEAFTAAGMSRANFYRVFKKFNNEGVLS